jgi:predicted N-formylglutamate amidohydrolase
LRAIPAGLGRLGLAQADLECHIAWDIGALAVAEKVSEALNAPMVHQLYSRLVVDCKRQAHAHDAIPVLSEYTEIPGNADLSEADRLIRWQEIHAPYHAAIADLLDRRDVRQRRNHRNV